MSPAFLTIISATALAAAGIAATSFRRETSVQEAPPSLALAALAPKAYSPAAARAGAGARGASIPLPAGGNFNGIRWELADGEIPAATMEFVLQYNAACQWLRAWRRGDAGAVRTLRTAASWSAFRGGDAGTRLGSVAAEARRGGGENASAMLADCRATHRREVTYARRLGLTPST